MYQGGVLAVGYPFAPDSHAGDPLESGKPPMIFVPTVIMTSCRGLTTGMAKGQRDGWPTAGRGYEGLLSGEATCKGEIKG
jgi:hypothetical protein